MNPAFGIHVGNTSACLAVCRFKADDSTKFSVEVIANHAGERVMPAVVTVGDTETVVGSASKSLLISNWETTIKWNKRNLNRNTPEGRENGHRSVAMEMHDGRLSYVLPLDTVVHKTPTEIAAYIFSSLYDIAKSNVPGEENIACVLMVPKHFSQTAQFKLEAAAQDAGFDILQIINEPSAAVLGYHTLSDKTPPPQQFLVVYRVGGRSCDATLFDMSHGFMTIVEHVHADNVGGRLLVLALTKYLAAEFYRKFKLDPNESHRSITKLYLAAENCLHILSTIESSNFFVESLCSGVDFSYIMTRARLESILFQHLSEFTEPLHTLFIQYRPDIVSTVLLCGGPIKIPRLRKHIADFFSEVGTNVVPLPNGVNYDEVLAYGAAYQAGCMTTEKMRDSFLPRDITIPVLKSAIAIQIEGAESDVVEFEVDTPLPCHKNVRLSSPQEEVKIVFLQVDEDESILRGEVKLFDLEDPADITIDLDSVNGLSVKVSPESVHEVSMTLYEHPILTL